MQLIKLSDDHYVVVDDSEIKEGDWFIDMRDYPDVYDEDLYVARIGGDVEFANKIGKKITHSTQPLNKSLFFTDRVWGCERLSLGEVKELIGEVDVIKKAKKYAWKTDYQGAFIAGYNQALEDNKEKKYTEEDLADAINMARNEPDMSGNAIIQSLQPQTEWEVEFINGQLKLK